MLLKKLELLGFKSFADRTEFVFPPGVTCIVGPNGCGKSNVVDAFKWIVGEQSAKGLRGSEMKDVIFNGTLSRKPAGFAEVTVTFDNSDRFLDIDYSEVAITRRLFRSGESEYLINRQRCRLKDIKELLLDTGIGRSSYSVLEQGKIDVLLQASTLDRRVIFEEAAGISKYRVKKAEALRSLVRVSENLSRLQDIIDEVEKRVRRVKVQAVRARKYKEYSERLKELRIRLSLEEYCRSVSSTTDLSFQLYWRDHQKRRLEDLIARLDRGLEGQIEMRQTLSREIEERRQSLAAEGMARERTEERLRQCRRRLEDLESEKTRRDEEFQAAAESLDKLRSALEGERARFQALLEEMAGRRERLEEAVGRLRWLQEAQEAREQAVAAGKKAVVEGIQRLSRAANQLVQIESEVRNLEARKERLAGGMERLEVELVACRAREAERHRWLEELGEQRAGLEAERAGLDAEVRALEGEIQAVAARLRQVEEEVHRTSSRHEVLKSLEEDLEGVASGAAEILRLAPELPPGTRSHGMVASLLRVARPYARAVEAVLAETAQALIVESQEGGLRLLDLVKARDLGGIQVVPLDRVEAPRPAYLARQGGVLGLLREYVDVDERFTELADCLFRSVVLVEDRATAVALARNGLRSFRLVTLEGEVLEPWGAMSAPGPAEAGLISRRSEMEYLEIRTRELEGERREVQASQASIEGRLEERRGEAQARTARLEELERRKVALEGELQQEAREADRLIRERQVSGSELAEVEADIEAREVERRRGQEEARAIEEQRRRTEEEVAAGDREIARAAAELEGAEEAVSRARLELAQAEQQEESNRLLLERQAANLREWEARLESLGRELEDIARRREETWKTLRESEAERERIAERESRLGAELESREEKDRGYVETEQAFRRELERLRSRLSEVSGEREALQLRVQEERHRRNTVLERVDEDYGVNLRDVLERATGWRDRAPGATAAGDGGAPGAAGPAVESPEEWEHYLAESEGWDREAARKEAKELQERIRRLGNVNLEALEELDELEERLRFQIRQREDLLESERNLRGIIGEINQKSRQLFLETFEKVQGHFNELFRKCFGGGKAELVLGEGLDVLEAGIEIVARPPGKKLTSLSLMSGGEKTMTTIALLLAIFRSRPSPFCLLDEVDAPLDETNVQRFVVLLGEFLDQSQFILITHNKLTMGAASTLYGVTTQERGVSKKVAVELESYDPESPELAGVAEE